MAKHIMISGQVQGVGFRFKTQQSARHYGLVGWVRNNPDGTVELEVDGSEKDVESLLNDLSSGFNHTVHVDEVRVEQLDKKLHDVKDFSIEP